MRRYLAEISPQQMTRLVLGALIILASPEGGISHQGWREESLYKLLGPAAYDVVTRILIFCTLLVSVGLFILSFFTSERRQRRKVAELLLENSLLLEEKGGQISNDDHSRRDSTKG